MESEHGWPYQLSVDYSVVLILPLSALVACATVVWAAATGRVRPRLIWPCAFSTVCGAAVFIGPPAQLSALLWVAMLGVVAVWAAFGTIIGGQFAKLSARLLRLR
jgi:hypothetical protein